MIILLRWAYRRFTARRAVRQVNSPAPAVRRPSHPARAAEGPLGLVAHQVRYNLISFARNRQGGLFTMLFPVMFLVVFIAVFGNHPVGAGHVNASSYYVPGIAALAVVTSSFANLVITLTTQRETGILRRRRVTPVPAWVLITGQALTAMAVSLVAMAVLLVIGRFAYGVAVGSAALPGVLLTTVIGSASFSCLAYGLSTTISSVGSATPTVQALVLPLYFISGVFIPSAGLPAWLRGLARVFPVEHLANGLHHAFVPAAHGAALPWADLAVLAAWAAAGLAVALRRFIWSPAAANS